MRKFKDREGICQTFRHGPYEVATFHLERLRDDSAAGSSPAPDCRFDVEMSLLTGDRSSVPLLQVPVDVPFNPRSDMSQDCRQPSSRGYNPRSRDATWASSDDDDVAPRGEQTHPKLPGHPEMPQPQFGSNDTELASRIQGGSQEVATPHFRAQEPTLLSTSRQPEALQPNFQPEAESISGMSFRRPEEQQPHFRSEPQAISTHQSLVPASTSLSPFSAPGPAVQIWNQHLQIFQTLVLPNQLGPWDPRSWTGMELDPQRSRDHRMLQRVTQELVTCSDDLTNFGLHLGLDLDHIDRTRNDNPNNLVGAALRLARIWWDMHESTREEKGEVSHLFVLKLSQPQNWQIYNHQTQGTKSEKFACVACRS